MTLIHWNIDSSIILSSANIFIFKIAGCFKETASEDPRFFRPMLIQISSFFFNFSKVAIVGDVVRVKSLELPLGKLVSKERLVKPAPKTQSEIAKQ